MPRKTGLPRMLAAILLLWTLNGCGVHMPTERLHHERFDAGSGPED